MGSNAQEAACPASPPTPLAAGPGYAYGQALIVLGAIPPAVAGLKVWGQLALPAAALSAVCMDVQQVGFMTRVPASLKVGRDARGAEGVGTAARGIPGRLTGLLGCRAWLVLPPVRRQQECTAGKARPTQA